MSSIVDHRIPVTILTGYLGAGKTTLLNHLIQQHPGKKFAIIENEFGDIGIDSELVVGLDGNNIFELSNGCICCTLNDDLYKVLNRLLNSSKPFNHLFIETTGIADPSSVIQPFLADLDIQMQFRMDGVICLADCRLIEDILKDEPEPTKQLALADLVVINKVSEVTEQYKQEVTGLINQINPHAIKLYTDFARTEYPEILNLNAFNPDNIEEQSKNIVAQDHTHSPHGQAIKAHSFIIKGNLDFDKFSLFMDYFLTFNQNSIYRIKGIMSFNEVPHRMVAQSVKTMFLMTDGKPWKNYEIRESRIVFIGKYLDAEVIKENLDSMLVY